MPTGIFFYSPNFCWAGLPSHGNHNMKKILSLLVIMGVLGCSNKKQYPPATDGLNAGLEFIGAILKGEFEKADFYMLQDERNKQLLEEARVKYASYSKDQKRQLREASLQNVEVENTTATEMILHYNNSFNNERNKLKVVQQGNSWLVDFKYKVNPNL
jgi:hypothetical protein